MHPNIFVLLNFSDGLLPSKTALGAVFFIYGFALVVVVCFPFAGLSPHTAVVVVVAVIVVVVVVVVVLVAVAVAVEAVGAVLAVEVVVVVVVAVVVGIRLVGDASVFFM